MLGATHQSPLLREAQYSPCCYLPMHLGLHDQEVSEPTPVLSQASCSLAVSIPSPTPSIGGRKERSIPQLSAWVREKLACSNACGQVMAAMVRIMAAMVPGGHSTRVTHSQPCTLFSLPAPALIVSVLCERRCFLGCVRGS